MRNNEQRKEEKSIEQCHNEMRASHQGKANSAFWSVAGCRSIESQIKNKPLKLSRKERRAAKRSEVAK